MREKIFKYVKEKYNIEPDYPFSTAPTYPVLRHADNRKCVFALIMDVPREKLGIKGTDYVDIINLKLGDPMLVDMIVGSRIFLRVSHHPQQLDLHPAGRDGSVRGDLNRYTYRLCGDGFQEEAAEDPAAEGMDRACESEVF